MQSPVGEMRAAMCSRSANPAGAVCRTADLTPLGARPAACQLRSATRQGPLPRAASRQQVPRRRPGLQVSAIGFDLPGAESNNKSEWSVVVDRQQQNMGQGCLAKLWPPNPSRAVPQVLRSMPRSLPGQPPASCCTATCSRASRRRQGPLLQSCTGPRRPCCFGMGLYLASCHSNLTMLCASSLHTRVGSFPLQAFLGILQLLQKGNPLLLVQQYGELYRLLVAEDCASWQDYLLDQVLCQFSSFSPSFSHPSPLHHAHFIGSAANMLQVIRGTENPLAKAAAAGKPTAHLRRAAAHDLDQLQRLAVGERTLAGWIKDTVYGGASEEWLEAASSLAPQQQHGAGQEPQAVHEALLRPAAPPPQLLAPLTEAQRAGLRAELAGKWKWSEGVDLLVRYHAAHGGGLVSAHSVLAWTGKLQAQDVLKGGGSHIGGPFPSIGMHEGWYAVHLPACCVMRSQESVTVWFLPLPLQAHTS